MAKRFDELLASYCAPALAGIKPSNMVSLDSSEALIMQSCMDRYNALLNPKDIYIDVLCCNRDRTLLLVYRKKQLENILKEKDIMTYLALDGYPIYQPLSAILGHLKSRMEAGQEGFPHEIGVFLGYPLEDVIAFTDSLGKKPLLTGYWKVYGNPDTARRLFERYTKCRDALCRFIANGKSILHIFHAA